MKKTILIILSLVSSVIYSQPIKSALAAKELSFEVDAETGPTARDYVLDGIATMIDGIENGGFGIHHKGPTTQYPIVDCITGTEYSHNTCYLIEDGIASTATTGFPYFQTGIFGLDEFTVEYVAFLDSDDYRSAFTSFIRGRESAKVYYPYMLMTSTNVINGITLRAGAYAGATTLTIGVGSERLAVYGFFKMTPYASTFGVGVNGGELEVKIATARSYIFAMTSSAFQTADYSYVQPDTGLRRGRVYAIRTYTRALTDEEILYNYSLDIERFGLQ